MAIDPGTMVNNALGQPRAERGGPAGRACAAVGLATRLLAGALGAVAAGDRHLQPFEQLAEHRAHVPAREVECRRLNGEVRHELQ